MFDTILVNFKVLIVIIRAKFVLFHIDDVDTTVLNVNYLFKFYSVQLSVCSIIYIILYTAGNITSCYILL